MRLFAEIPLETSVNCGAPGVVRCVFAHEPAWDPQYAPDTVIAVAVTDADPAVEAGFAYDFETGAFTPYEGWEPPPE